MAAVVYCPKCEADNACNAVLCRLCGHQLQGVSPLAWGHDVPQEAPRNPDGDAASQREPKHRSIFSARLPSPAGAPIHMPPKRRKLHERWNTPLAEMTMGDVVRCQVDLVLLGVLIGVAGLVLFLTFQYVTR